MNRSLLVGLVLGLGTTALALVAAPRPATLQRVWARLRLGGVPGPTGVALVVEPAPAGAAGPGAHVVVWHVNAGPTAALVCWTDPPGDELAFEVVAVSVGGDGGGAAAGGAALPLPPARGPEEPTVAVPGARLRRTWLAPGQRLGLVCDLSRWVALPGPGAYDVRASRVPWGDPRGGFDGVRCASAPTRVVFP